MAEDAGEKRAKWLEDRFPKIVERHDALPGETDEPTEDLYRVWRDNCTKTCRAVRTYRKRRI